MRRAIHIDDSRELIVGVIPHTRCKPKVAGCGFCTFGHNHYSRGRLRHDLAALPREIDHALTGAGHDFSGRKVEALYFGGGTANLTPVAELEACFERLAARLELRDAELTLEGVPSLFLSWFSAPLRWLAKLPVARPRLSMGVQTFDPAQLRRMGREHFGDAKLVARVVDEAREREITSSGDFLFNLPGQTRAQMLDDLERAVAIGFDQICIYNLVLYEGLGTPWSRDPALLAALPSGEQALANWLALREALLAAGYVQATLTNFERAEVHAGPRRFVYEQLSFSPDRVDGLGIGPLSMSTFIDFEQLRAVKLHRDVAPIGPGWPGYSAPDLYFGYAPGDLDLLILTRSLARMRWDLAGYRARFGAALEERHAEFDELCMAIVAAGLAERDADELRLTPTGMFYADSIAGLLAERRVAELRGEHVGAGLSTRQFVIEFHMG